MSRLPRRVVVAEVVKSRYSSAGKPINWDNRRPGVEKVKTTDDETLTLFSNGGQSTPKPGWELLLTKDVARSISSEEHAGESEGDLKGEVYAWTLYGIQPRP